ncbi:GNAT family N-acetyltransferase [Verrucomicrobiota bacterium]
MTPEDRQRFPPTTVALKDGWKGVIRPLRATDADALVDFYASIPREDFRFYAPHPLDRANAERNAKNADSPFEVVVVLETPKGKIGGYAWYRWKKETDTESVFGICLRRRHQGLGAGRALMTRLAGIARDLGPPVMTLTVQLANSRAVSLYRQMGFEVVKQDMRAPGASCGFPPEPQYHMELRVR